MTDPHAYVFETDGGYVSTGTLPTREEVRALIETAYARFRGETNGKVADGL